MSVDVGNEATGTVKAVVDELKDIPKPATKEGIATNLVGYILSIPLSYAYDFVYNLVSKKVITNEIVSDILKVALPAGVGAIFHFGKLPAGNIVAGSGYGIALLSLIKIIIARIKGVKGLKKKAVGSRETEPLIDSLWGIEQ